MKHSIFFSAVLMTLAEIAVPGPAGATGATGDRGKTGNTVVIVPSK